jgi:hypothetical protein
MGRQLTQPLASPQRVILFRRPAVTCKMRAMQSDLTSVVILLGAALAVAWLMRAVKVPAIVGFLLAGIVMPSHGRYVGALSSPLDVRARTGAMIVAVTRGGVPTPSPPPDFPLQAGDVLVLVGTHKQLDEAKVLLEAASATSSGA